MIRETKIRSRRRGTEDAEKTMREKMRTRASGLPLWIAATRNAGISLRPVRTLSPAPQRGRGRIGSRC